MEWAASLPTTYLRDRSFYGDTDGQKRTGVTMDSFYSILEPFGIFINKDRMPDGEAVGFRKQAREHKGRQEALRELSLKEIAFFTPCRQRWSIDFPMGLLSWAPGCGPKDWGISLATMGLE